MTAGKFATIAQVAAIPFEIIVSLLPRSWFTSAPANIPEVDFLPVPDRHASKIWFAPGHIVSRSCYP
jgi:hypothetical protein